MSNQNQQPNQRLEAAKSVFEESKESRPSRGSVVTVACKMPGGLLLRVGKMVERSETVSGGGTRKYTQWEQIGEAVKIHGYAVPFGQERQHPVAGGFALTHGVPAEFMERWLEDNQDLDAVRNGLIVVHEKESFVIGEAKEKKDVRSGLEAMDPETKRNGRYIDPRMPAKIEKATTKDAA